MHINLLEFIACTIGIWLEVIENENHAYLTIKDKLINKYVFQGWMFSSSPSLSSLEHPINDIWLLNCSNK